MQITGRNLQREIYNRFPFLEREHSITRRRTRVHFVPVTDRLTKTAFDSTLDLIHYAGSCQRVGRCLRLCIYEGDVWVGGIVLGSTFPNIGVRDDNLGLKKFVRATAKRGLRNPWSRENVGYWSALQFVVNHARTFVFPRFQGQGLGVAAHKELLKTGLVHWERRYQHPVLALDTLCTHSDSKLFSRNGWRLIGNTTGYTSDPSQEFSSRAFVGEWKAIRNNIALKRIAPGSNRWWVWLTVTNDEGWKQVLTGRHLKQAKPPEIRRGLRLR